MSICEMTTLVSFLSGRYCALSLPVRPDCLFGIDGCFVEREVQIGTSASSRTFLSSSHKGDERYVRMDIEKDVQAGQIGGVCMAGDSASSIFDGNARRHASSSG